jgi:hypothetical protein
MWQLGHSAGAISTAPQVVAVAAQLQGWMLAWGIRGACQIISEHFWIDGGECGEGRAVVLGRGTHLMRARFGIFPERA